MAGVRVKNLRKTYASVVAADGLSFEATDRAITTLLGPSGCGKTTTLRCIAGLEDVDDGEIYIGDELVSSKERKVSPNRRNVGMVFQSYALWPHMTVYQNVAYGLGGRHLSGGEIREKVSNALSLVKLLELQERFPLQLSGGEQQRVALARAIAYDPTTLLLDEPLSNLDAKLRESTRFELVELQRRIGLTSIYVTHDQVEAMAISDTVIIMNKGRIAQIGTPRSVYTEPRDEFVANFVGAANILRGKVRARDGGRGEGVVELEGGRTLRYVSSVAGGDARVLVLLRPEKLRLSDGPAGGDNSFECQILLKAFLGDRIDYRIEVMGREWRVSANTWNDFPEGKRLHVQIDPTDVVMIPDS